MTTDSHPSRVIADTVVDRENPWPGLRAYNERGKDYFKGRRDVARDLLRLIVREDLVLLYGISGLGKTSLLKAGVFPDLPANFLPVYLRLNFVSPEAQDARNGRRPLTSSDLAAQVVAATQTSARLRNVEPPSRPPVPERGLWEYFRRADDVTLLVDPDGGRHIDHLIQRADRVLLVDQRGERLAKRQAAVGFPVVRERRVEGVGVACYVRLDSAPEVAEIAVTVIDDYQKLGIGGRLLQRIGWEARQQGIRRFSGIVMHENIPMLKLLERHARGLVRHVTGDHVEIEVPLVGAA